MYKERLITNIGILNYTSNGYVCILLKSPIMNDILNRNYQRLPQVSGNTVVTCKHSATRYKL